MAERDGGPAFPESVMSDHAGDVWESKAGMSLRDYFAAAALSGIMANPERWKQIAEDYTSGKKTYEQCSAANAAKAWSLADAMLAERGKTDPLRDAAPDLLAALEEVHNILRADDRFGALAHLPAGGLECEELVENAVLVARAAIAKAKGGEG